MRQKKHLQQEMSFTLRVGFCHLSRMIIGPFYKSTYTHMALLCPKLLYKYRLMKLDRIGN